MRRGLIALLTAGLAITGPAVASPAHATPAHPAPAHPAPAARSSVVPPPVAFHPCASPALKAAGADCGTVQVPLNHDRPTGPTIDLAISRVKHDPSVPYQGIMLVNPGGPGGSGLGLSRLGATVPHGAGKGYDWIGFDPRGVGASEPSLHCVDGYAGYDRPAYTPDDPHAEAAWLARSRAYAASCGVRGADLLRHLRTVDSARDMDSIRLALGAGQLNYYGFSYGTYLGAVYATLFPQHVRRMVFDGVIDPRGVWERANYSQDTAFETSIGVFFAWVARHDAVYHLGTSEAAVRRVYDQQEQALRHSPAGGKIGSSEWNDIFLQAGYYVFNWEQIASAFSTWVNRHDARGLLALYPKPGDDNEYAVYLGVQCTDAHWSRYPAFRRENREEARHAPFETWANAWYNAPCSSWPAPAGTPTRIDGHAAPPILLVSETKDAATPFTGALAVRSRFPRSALVEGVGGTTHAGTLARSPGFGSPCENDAVASYLADGTLPARKSGNRSDQQCAPIPQPNPTALRTPGQKPAAAATTTTPVPPSPAPSPQSAGPG